MFIDYLSLMLINLVAGFVLLATFVYFGLEGKNPKRWIPGFGMTGIIALITGFHTVFNWILPSSYNIAFGELSVLFGIVFLGASVALAQGWDLHTVTLYAFFAGLAAILIGVRVISLGMTKASLLSGIGFIFSGLGGVFAAPTLYWHLNSRLKLIGATILMVAALIWAFNGYQAYWDHLEAYLKWMPSTMR
ncbi:MAG: DUF981 family protein [Leptolyngbya sp. BL-A-14]